MHKEYATEQEHIDAVKSEWKVKKAPHEAKLDAAFYAYHSEVDAAHRLSFAPIKDAQDKLNAVIAECAKFGVYPD